MKQPPDIQVKEDQPEPKPWLRFSKEASISVLNLQEVALSWQLHQFIRKIASDMTVMPKPYASAGSIFYAMPNYAVADFYEMQEGFEEEYLNWLQSKDLDSNLRLKNLTTLAFLIARAEGMPDIKPFVLMEALPNLCSLIKLESKYRKGLATVNYYQYSLFNADKLKPGFMNKKPEGAEGEGDSDGTTKV